MQCFPATIKILQQPLTCTCTGLLHRAACRGVQAVQCFPANHKKFQQPLTCTCTGLLTSAPARARPCALARASPTGSEGCGARLRRARRGAARLQQQATTRQLPGVVLVARTAAAAAMRGLRCMLRLPAMPKGAAACAHCKVVSKHPRQSNADVERLGKLELSAVHSS